MRYFDKRKCDFIAFCFDGNRIPVGLLCPHREFKNGTGVSGVTIQIDCVINYGVYKRYRRHYSPIGRWFCFVAYYVAARTKGYCWENNSTG